MTLPGGSYKANILTTENLRNPINKVISCVNKHVSIIMTIQKLCLSVCPYPKKRNHPSFVNISPTLLIDTSMERSS